MKLFWKEVSNAKGGKLDGNGRLALLQVVVHMYGFDGVHRGNYFGGEPVGRAEVKARVGKFKNREATGKDEINGEIIKGGDDRVVYWVWRL